MAGRSLLVDTPRTKSRNLRSQRNSNIQGLKNILISPISLLLLCVPCGILSPHLGGSQSCTFWLNFFAMIPLAKILGDATEELAMTLNNDMLSGLLNATFGNAVEMIMTVNFLKSHEYVVVKSTMLGSMLSNMLLVLGMSFLCGGLVQSKAKNAEQPGEEPLLPRSGIAYDKEQGFSSVGAMVNTTMLLVCCLMLVLVTVFDYTNDIDNNGKPFPFDADRDILPVSRICSILMVSSYGAYLVFELLTHRHAIADEENEEEEEEVGDLTFAWSIGLLMATTVVVSVCSEFLTGSLEGVLEGSGMGRSFLGIILLPIVGNACEHAAAIRFALQDKAGLSVGIAIGSSVQIALFVTPFSVLMGWALGDAPGGVNMDLNFGPLNVAVLTMSVIVILAIVVDGKSNWLEGYMLCTAYAMIAVLYWYVQG